MNIINRRDDNQNYRKTSVDFNKSYNKVFNTTLSIRFMARFAGCPEATYKGSRWRSQAEVTGSGVSMRALFEEVRHEWSEWLRLRVAQHSR